MTPWGFAERLGREVILSAGPVATLHVHVDESGDFNFTPRGSRYYAFAVAWTYDPAPLAHALTQLRFGLLKASHDLSSFHAVDDRQVNRNEVVARMLQHQRWSFAAMVIEKCKVNPAIRDPQGFYPQFAAMVLRFVFRGRIAPGTTRVQIFTDTIPVHRKEPVEIAFKTACRADLPRGMRFDIYHHPRASNKWIQVADYCCWSVHRKWERGDARTYQQLRGRLVTPELNVTARGLTRYYRHPLET